MKRTKQALALTLCAVLLTAMIPAMIPTAYANDKPCTTCNGAGGRNCNTCDGRGFTSGGKSCPNFSCSGGWVKCTFCGGTGRIPDSGSSGGGGGGGGGGGSPSIPNTPDLTTEQINVADYPGYPGVPDYGAFSGAEFKREDFPTTEGANPYRRFYKSNRTHFYQYLKLLELKGFVQGGAFDLPEFNRVDFEYELFDLKITLVFTSGDSEVRIAFNSLPQTPTQPTTPTPGNTTETYPGTSVRTFTAVTGISLNKTTNLDGGKTQYVYTYTDAALTQYRNYLSGLGYQFTKNPHPLVPEYIYKTGNIEINLVPNTNTSALSVFVSTSTNPLDSASTWAKDGITAATGKGFVPADIQGSYTNTITRAEFCRLAVKWVEYATNKKIDTVLAEKGLSRNPGAFTDTSDPDILAAYALGITSGSGGGQFNPNGQFNREQAAGMIMNVYKAIGIEVSGIPASGFADIGTASSWAIPGINFVKAFGIMGGTGNNNFSPKLEYTREQSILTFNNIKL